MTKNHSFLIKSASIFSIIISFTLLVIKFFAFDITSALSILAGLVDSLLDIVASVVNYFSVRYALNPADDDHRFGHGKAEALAGLSQSTLIATSVVLLITESVQRIWQPHDINQPDIGIIVSLISILLTAILVAYQNYVVKKTSSLAIKADMLQYKSDFLLNISIMVSLFITSLTGYVQVDTILAICISFMILWGVKQIFTQSVDQILDKELPEIERKKIYYLATAHPKVHEIHDLRTRSSGHGIFVQFHMELPPETLLLDAHHISDEVEANIIKGYGKKIEVFIHIDPLGHPRENPETF